MPTFKFADCGCEFPITNITLADGRPSIKFVADINHVNINCKKTWDLLCAGNTKGCFQLESPLGQSLARKMKPRNIEHLAALISIMRPGCVSGKTNILVRKYKKNNKTTYIRKTLEHIYKNQKQYDSILSYNETTGKLENNFVKCVIYQGTKDVYKIHFKKFNRTTITEQIGKKDKQYDLNCTLDHRLLTPKGWKELQELVPGDKFAILKYNGTRKTIKYVDGKHSFKEICLRNYDYHCIFCDWKEGSLDVNHLDGNRFTNNNADNLCFMCPNHHRMYSEHNITKEQCLIAREKYKLPQNEDVEWVEYIDKSFVETTDTYDISMLSPHHNFIAGNVVVHNCLEAIRDKKSVTMHYIDKKNGIEELSFFHPSLEPALKTTYGEMVYQEQAMQIARDIAGFTMQEADELRKAIGKKLPEAMAKVKTKFLEGTAKSGVVTEDEAHQIFDWIEKSQRYSFNKCITPDTIVDTKDGYKTIEEINIGEDIKTVDGYTKVVNKYDNGKQEVYEITLESGKTIKCTMEHQFVCDDGIKRTLLEIIENNHQIMTSGV